MMNVESHTEKGQERIRLGSVPGMSLYLFLSIGLFLVFNLTAAAATLTVTNTDDSGAGSLRQAIADAASGDTINFDPSVTGTITLTSQLVINKNLTISGPGAANLTVSGNNSRRVFYITSGTVTISGLTIANGNANNESDFSFSGGGVRNDGALTVSDCAFSGNHAGQVGGGIYNNHTPPGTLTVINSTFSSNSVGPFGCACGGGIGNDSIAAVINSTFSGNRARLGGGGIFSGGNGQITISNCTITGSSGDSAISGGIFINNGTVVAGLSNTISAGNSPADCFGTFTSGDYNLIQNPTSNCTLAGTHNIIGQDPLLGPLQDNGGPTFTHELLPDSPATDAGNPAALGGGGNACDATDQRGIPRPVDGDDNGAAVCDIGAYEVSGPTPAGSDVEVQPVDTTTGTAPVALTFSDVSEGGNTNLTTGNTGPTEPSGFKLGNPPTYYEVTTSAVFSGSVEVCINYTGVSFKKESSLKLFHFEDGRWENRTTSQDTTNNIICGIVDSLSPFALFEEEVSAVCGDGVVDSGEECDDGNTVDGDCCAATCEPEPSGTACGDAGGVCTNQDTCDGQGACTDNGFQPSGTSCGDISDTACNAADTCNGAGSCQANLATAGTACGDAGSACVNQDTCDGAGSCADNGFQPSGTACGDGTDTDCNNPDTCNATGSCQVNLEPNGTACSDGNACTSGDVCSGGSCNGGSPPTCNDNNNCTTDACNPASGCTNTVLTCNGQPATLCGTAGKDNLIGTAGPDVILGLEGNDTIEGRDGNDRLCGGAGQDNLQAGKGNDRVFGEGGNDRLNGGAGTDECNGGPGQDSATACEQVKNVP